MLRPTLALVALALLAPRSARADDTIKHPGDHPQYLVEVEPHVELAWADWSTGLDVGPGAGFGLGVRFDIPIVKNGFVPNINDNVAIGFGFDYLHFSCGGFIYEGFAPSCNLNSISFPVVMQWNFYVGRRWSAFGEPGLFLYHQFVDVSCGGNACPSADVTSVLPAFWVGGRYHVNSRLALIGRIGYPTLTLGVSFFD